jgi:hypothetical protein
MRSTFSNCNANHIKSRRETMINHRSHACFMQIFKSVDALNGTNDGRNINFIHRSSLEREMRGRRSLSFLVISVSLYVCHSRRFFFMNFFFFPINWMKYLTLIWNYRTIIFLSSHFLLQRHMISTVVNGLYELEAWIIIWRSSISKNSYHIFRKKNKKLVQRFYGRNLLFVYLIFFEMIILERLPKRRINPRVIYPNL